MKFVPTYYAPTGGLPDQNQRARERAHFTESYAVIPRGTMSDITISYLPGWDKSRAWVLARPLTGFSETFAQLVVEVAPGGGSKQPEPDKDAQGVIFILEGHLRVTIKDQTYELDPGGYVYLAPGEDWTIANTGDTPSTLMWVRKIHERAPGIDLPESFVTADKNITPIEMPDTAGYWSTTRFVDPSDMRHDMHVNIVTFMPGGTIPFAETHVMEHGLYVLQGRGVYLLNQDWVEVEEGDFMWLRAFCPQACYAAGRRPFRYLLYKDVNRHVNLRGIFSR
ncbi:(S)-ureidoglycine aminohydrolase [Thioclava sp. SK-1]|uniref:bifunctional allantoicase/(S)-ureidoglycine aminohydrolase n=1 Tax=Thioclava sp. SK-1 TaxID=1889770 RepID=UPI000826FA2B|nr:bifunctional allantoicase/(S)-ureidoglycine aminohydrolase [Thioclava sp. SK-1]OCX66549.1 (S)-ureidoglycine aminohydrolase [Thioclava sp. SK-1]